jgi:hypothetical protein
MKNKAFVSLVPRNEYCCDEERSKGSLFVMVVWQFASFYRTVKYFLFHKLFYVATKIQTLLNKIH